MVKYTHAVVYKVRGENGNPVDELYYCTDINHAYSIANQYLAAGFANVALIEIKEPKELK